VNTSFVGTVAPATVPTSPQPFLAASSLVTLSRNGVRHGREGVTQHPPNTVAPATVPASPQQGPQPFLSDIP
jgi:hypothetical protein